MKTTSTDKDDGALLRTQECMAKMHSLHSELLAARKRVWGRNGKLKLDVARRYDALIDQYAHAHDAYVAARRTVQPVHTA